MNGAAWDEPGEAADGAGGLPDPVERSGRPRKSPSAFRTISEVADDLHIPQHVLRFWETRFGQVKPLKRGGGRRYYRPDDIVLLRRISDLLYIQGYTIKGVQRLLREGDGTLSGELMPPELADIGEEPEEVVVPDRAEIELATMAEPSPDQAIEQAAHAALETELSDLRALLGLVLIELESLRAQLPA